MKQKIFKIEKEHILDAQNMFFSHIEMYSMFTTFNIKFSDNIYESYDNVSLASPNTVFCRDNILIFAGLGLYIYKIEEINNTLNIVKLFYNTRGLYHIAVSWENKKIFGMDYIFDPKSDSRVAVMEFDFNDLNNIKYRDGILLDHPDMISYTNASRNRLAVCGDYLYAGSNRFGLKMGKVLRYKISTEIVEEIPTPSDIIDMLDVKYGIRSLMYDEKNDRLYFLADRYICVMIQNASKSLNDINKPEVFPLNGVNAGNCGTMTVDKVNPNIIWKYRYLNYTEKYDISPIFENKNNDCILLSRSVMQYLPPYWIAASVNTSQSHILNNIICLSTDYNSPIGWYDQENNLMINLSGNDRKPSLDDVYISNDKIIGYRANVTNIKLKSGKDLVILGFRRPYGHFYIFNHEKFYSLDTYSEITFGVFKFENNDNIYSFNLNDKYNLITIPTDCSIEIFVTNNNKDWEFYDYTKKEAHVFSTAGKECKFKIKFYGTVEKSPYILNQEFYVMIFNKKNKIYNQIPCSGGYNDCENM